MAGMGIRPIGRLQPGSGLNRILERFRAYLAHEKAIDYLKTALCFVAAAIVGIILIWLFPDKNISICTSSTLIP